jgi:hypothetical protein
VRLRANGHESPLEVVLSESSAGAEPVLVEIPLKAFGEGAFLTGVEAVEVEADTAFEMTLARLSVSPMTAGKRPASHRRPS